MSDPDEKKVVAAAGGAAAAPADALDGAGLLLLHETGIMKDKKKKRGTAKRTAGKATGGSGSIAGLRTAVSEGAAKTVLYRKLDNMYNKFKGTDKEKAAAIAKVKYAIEDGKSKKTILAMVDKL